MGYRFYNLCFHKAQTWLIVLEGAVEKVDNWEVKKDWVVKVEETMEESKEKVAGGALEDSAEAREYSVEMARLGCLKQHLVMKSHGLLKSNPNFYHRRIVRRIQLFLASLYL